MPAGRSTYSRVLTIYTIRMKSLLLCLPALALVCSLTAQPLRVVVETDLGGDADDQASLVRWLLYTNEWDVELLLFDRADERFLHDRASHNPSGAASTMEMAHDYLSAYAAVYSQLRQHDPRYPHPDTLRARSVHATNDTEAGVDRLIALADAADPRPIWYANWGSNSGTVSNLRRAFDRVQAERSPQAYRRFVGRFRIVTLDGPDTTRQGHDDALALHIETGYPTLDGRRWYHELRPLLERAGGFDVERDVRTGHGALGRLYTTPKEGDSWTFLYLIPTGLGVPDQPTWGSWAGRYGHREGRDGPFYWANLADTWSDSTHRRHTVLRWADDIQHDFQARLDWCVQPYATANHPPRPILRGDSSLAPVFRTLGRQRRLRLDATSSYDPDGDRLIYDWLVYNEVNRYGAGWRLRPRGVGKATLILDRPLQPAEEVHLILRLRDAGTPPLTRYRRIVIRR